MTGRKGASVITGSIPRSRELYTNFFMMMCGAWFLWHVQDKWWFVGLFKCPWAEKEPRLVLQSVTTDAETDWEGPESLHIPSKEQIQAVQFKDCVESCKVGPKIGPWLEKTDFKETKAISILTLQEFCIFRCWFCNLWRSQRHIHQGEDPRNRTTRWEVIFVC